MTDVTWQDVVNAEVGHVFIDRIGEGVRFMVLRGPVSLCAYVGVPLDHPLAGHDYEFLPIHAHGGLTYAGTGREGYLPAERFWYGWNYAHAGDVATYSEAYRWEHNGTDKKWTPEDVNEDAWGAIYDFKKLVQLAESIVNRKDNNHAL